MKIIICGAGQVGFGIAERLSAEDNDVTVVDTSARLVRAVSDTLDVQGIVGHGAHPDMLAQAGASEADMIIAVTFTDEVNMMACEVANAIFNIPTKIARVRAQPYLLPEYRRLVAQAVLWSVRLPIPQNGLDVELDEDLYLLPGAAQR